MIHFYENEGGAVRLVHGTQITHSFPRHTHHSFSVGIIGRGERLIVLQEGTLAAGPGCIFMIPPDTPHACICAEPAGHNYWVWSFSRDFLYVFCRESGRDHKGIFHTNVRVFYDPILYRKALCLIFLWRGSRPQGRLKTMHSFLTFLLAYGPDHAAKQFEAGSHHYRPQNIHIQKIKAYIEQNLAKSIALRDLGCLLDISPFYVNRLFRTATGLPPHAYRIQERIKRAQKFLRDGLTPVYAALETGFAD